jgi:LysM repeat protein
MGSDHINTRQTQVIQLIRRIRKLYRYLAISIGSNIGLMALIVYLGADRYFDPYTSLTTHRIENKHLGANSNVDSDRTNREVVEQLQKLTYGQLMMRLRDTQGVEDGYTQRDLALAVLVSMHGLDLERALPNQRLDFRLFSIGTTGQKIPLFPGLSDREYQQVLEFVQRERWPLTNKGLFYLMRAQRAKNWDPSLVETFCNTEEFLACKALFSSGGVPSINLGVASNSSVVQEPNRLIEMVLSGSWETLQTYSQLQRLQSDFSSQRRQSLLLEYIDQKVPIAAELMIEYEQAFALKRATDDQVVAILGLLPSNATGENYAKELLLSPRSNLVWKRAAAFLYSAAGESVPEPYEHVKTIARFIPAERLDQLRKESQSVAASIPSEQEVAATIKKIAPIKPPVAKKERIYIVQPGDNLWKIGRRHGVWPEVIQEYNGLADNRLQVGQELRIPINS